MNRIIGFDSWTAGSRHFERLVEPLERRGYELLLIHIGSWGHDKGRPEEEKIGRLLVRDISYYRGKSFRAIIEMERPCAILFLSTLAFAHMTFNRYAMVLGIPTCHLYHGLVTVQAVGMSQQAYKVNPIRQAFIIHDRLIKNVFRLIPLYAKSLIATRAPLSIWGDLLKLIIIKLSSNMNRKRSLTDTTTDIGCVYTLPDVDHMQRVYGLKAGDITVVGNPDLISFGLRQHDIGSALHISGRDAEVIYIDTALIEAGVCFKDADDFVDHLKNTHDILAKIGFRFAVKLHPAHFKTDLPEKLQKLHINLVDNDSFVPRLRVARTAIVEPTTAAMIPALLGLPLLLCQYGKLTGQAYGSVLTSYPRSRVLMSLDDLPRILAEEQANFRPEPVCSWIGCNAGPMPAENMPDRVAAAIDHMVRERQSFSSST